MQSYIDEYKSRYDIQVVLDPPDQPIPRLGPSLEMTLLRIAQDANRPGSHGLTIMRERADAFGGRLNVGSISGKGTKVEVSIPLQNGNQNKVWEEKQG